MSPRVKKPLGMLALMAGLIAWIVAVVSGVEALRPLPAWAEIGLYVVAGVIWALPLKPFLGWMNRA